MSIASRDKELGVEIEPGAFTGSKGTGPPVFHMPEKSGLPLGVRGNARGGSGVTGVKRQTDRGQEHGSGQARVAGHLRRVQIGGVLL
jgi:hypothetical protein